MDLNEYYGVDPRELSTLSLAYVGDAVFELMVRTELISRFNTTAGALHKKAKQIVNAKAQSDMYFRIEKYFDETEKAVFKRGRNAKSATVPKNADISDYRHATGLETVFGYLYLTGNFERLRFFIREGLEI